MNTEEFTNYLRMMFPCLSYEALLEGIDILNHELQSRLSKTAGYSDPYIEEYDVPEECMVRKALVFTLFAKDTNGDYLMNEPHHWYAIYKVLVHMRIIKENQWKEMEELLNRHIEKDKFRLAFDKSSLSHMKNGKADVDFRIWYNNTDNNRIKPVLRDIAIIFYNKLVEQLKNRK